eukprot:gnl/TRDRNA2_/TRDRNA2_194612_c0_seq1.p1 gnl/TRDRNA2_/TRDRNA2_194612_c0~~gnl/TRDRNA2_/TRDRNA2_194612_c0_seq1.p1  ORF type:complete len:300 (+),score=81.91 gnl/TRDRNA2_/TRDRNA2_194612_c0_seq1:83-901(+)
MATEPQKLLLAPLLLARPDAGSIVARNSSAPVSRSRPNASSGPEASRRSDRWWRLSEEEDDESSEGKEACQQDGPRVCDAEQPATEVQLRQRLQKCVCLLRELQEENTLLTEELSQEQSRSAAAVEKAETLARENDALRSACSELQKRLSASEAEDQRRDAELHRAQAALVSIVPALERRIEEAELRAAESDRALQIAEKHSCSLQQQLEEAGVPREKIGNDDVGFASVLSLEAKTRSCDDAEDELRHPPRPAQQAEPSQDRPSTASIAAAG